MEACLEKTEATDLEANPEEIDFEGEHEEVPKEESAVENLELQRSGMGTSIAVGCHRELKKLTQSNGGSQKKLVASCRHITHRAIPAWRKRHCCQRQGKDKSVPRTQKGHMFGKRCRAKPEGISGIRD
jgi:hypothetical protein